MIPQTMRPRIMRTQAGIQATLAGPQSPGLGGQQPVNRYSGPGPMNQATPWATSATSTPGASGQSAGVPLRGGPAQATPNPVMQVSKQGIGSSFDGGDGLSYAPGRNLSPQARPQAQQGSPGVQVRSPAAQAALQGGGANRAPGFQQLVQGARAAASKFVPPPAPVSVAPTPTADQEVAGVEPSSSAPGGDYATSGGGLAAAEQSTDPGQSNDTRGTGYVPLSTEESAQAEQDWASAIAANGGKADGLHPGSFALDGHSSPEAGYRDSRYQSSDNYDYSGLDDQQAAAVRALLDSRRYWIDDKGNVWAKSHDGTVNLQDQSSMYGNIHDGSLSGPAAADWKKAGGGRASTPEDIVREILDWDAPQIDERVTNQKIAADDAMSRRSVAAAQQSALGSGSRARMGAGWMSGTAATLANQGGLQHAQTAANLRMETEMQNFAARRDFFDRQIQSIMAIAGYAENDKARAAVAALERQRIAADQQLAQLQHQWSQEISPGQILGMLGGAAGSIGGSALGTYIGRK